MEVGGFANEVCRMYRNNGSCRYGEDCKFEHSEGEPIAPGGGGAAGECFAFRDEGSCDRGDACRYTHGENDPRFGANGLRDISREECRNWTRGTCRFGDQCSRMHVGEEGANTGGGRSRGGGGGGGSRGGGGERRQKKERTPGVCFDFQRGECDRGDECRFSHDPDVVAAAGPAPERGPPRGGEKLDEICNNFLAGKCRYGDDCRRIH